MICNNTTMQSFSSNNLHYILLVLHVCHYKWEFLMTSAKDILFSVQFVCMSVSLSAGAYKINCPIFLETWCKEGTHSVLEQIQLMEWLDKFSFTFADLARCSTWHWRQSPLSEGPSSSLFFSFPSTNECLLTCHAHWPASLPCSKYLVNARQVLNTLQQEIEFSCVVISWGLDSLRTRQVWTATSGTKAFTSAHSWELCFPQSSKKSRVLQMLERASQSLSFRVLSNWNDRSCVFMRLIWVAGFFFF